MPGEAPPGASLDIVNPMRRAGTAAARPASGPATATSIKAFRFKMPPRMRMTAPNVPSKEGAGRK